MRFSTSIRIMKGVRVNFYTSGVSLSVLGTRISLNPNKVLNTLGIKSTSNEIPANLKIQVKSDGSVIILNGEGKQMTDESLLRKIKKTDSYKNTKARLMEQRKINIENETNKFIDIYKYSAFTPNRDDYNLSLEMLTPKCYARNEFSELPPNKNDIEEEIRQ